MIQRTPQTRNNEQAPTAAVPPSDTRAEQSVLGCCLLEPHLIDEISDVLQPVMFYSSVNRMVFQRLLALKASGTPIDIVVIANDIKAAGLLDEIGGPAYLNTLMQACTLTVHWDYHCKLVRDAYLRRCVIEQGMALSQKAFDLSEDTDTVVAAAQQQISELIEQRDGTKWQSVGDIATDFLDFVTSGKTTGHQTGFIDLDALTTGVHDEQLIVVAARPGAGKTALALALARNFSKSGIPTLMFSLEMGKNEIMMRLVSMETVVTVTEMRSGSLTPEHIDVMSMELNCMYDTPLFIDDRCGITLTQISSAVRSAVRKCGVKCIIVDYLQLMEAEDTKLAREQQIARISRGLKMLARSLKIPVIALAQLNRDVEKRKDKRPMLSDLRESGAIEQDADQVWMLHRQEMYEEEGSAEWIGCRGVAEVLVRKNRNGPTGDVKLQFQADRMLFRNLASQYLDDPEEDDHFHT